MAQIERTVNTRIAYAKSIINNVVQMPAFPIINPKRINNSLRNNDLNKSTNGPTLRNKIALNIDKATGVKTPENVVRFLTECVRLDLFGSSLLCDGELRLLNHLKNNDNLV